STFPTRYRRWFYLLLVQMEHNLRVFRAQHRMIRLAVISDDLTHVVLRLCVRRYAFVLINRAFAGVVSRERKTDVTIETLQQPRQILRAGFHVSGAVIRIRKTETLGSCRHHLHEPARSDV